MKRFLLWTGPLLVAVAASVVTAGSDQTTASTQPATRPVFDGPVLSMAKPSAPATMPSAKPPEVAPAFGVGDGGGDHVTGVLRQGGIGATIVPSNVGTVPATQPVGR